MPRPFAIRVPDPVLADLRHRLAATRWPDELEDAGWAYGVPLAWLRDMTAYWAAEFDWRARERRLNAFSHVMVRVDGMELHAARIPARKPARMPLLLLHGWPSTFAELLDLGALLANPIPGGGGEAFDVVAPSLPGHGFSARPTRRGFEDRQAAALMVGLMEALGYHRFGIHAYDLGASVAGLLCLDFPDRVVGYHTTSPGNPAPFVGPGSPPLTDAEAAFLAAGRRWQEEEGGYAHIQGTRPQTLAYGLNDSPAGLAAWILDKWRSWTLPPGGGDLLARVDRDLLLENVTIYWATETINAANRYYRETLRGPGLGEVARTPHGVAMVHTQAFERPPREFVARLFPDIRRWVELPRGGHFVAAEEPALVAEQIREFFGEIG